MFLLKESTVLYKYKTQIFLEGPTYDKLILVIIVIQDKLSQYILAWVKSSSLKCIIFKMQII